MGKLVSIIAPCYNMENYIKNFLESILNQTYSNIELIIVNDPDTTDNSEIIIKEYIQKFKEKGYILKYIINEISTGAAGKINTGLKHIHGEYLMWMDSDDILMEMAISEKVSFFDKNPGKEFSLCSGIIVNEELKKIGTIGRKSGLSEEDLFSDYIYEKDVVCCPCTFFIKTDAFNKLYPSMQIYENMYGQNWQLILPAVYCLNYGYIDKELYKYLFRENSESHKNDGYDFIIKKREGFINILKHTINSIPLMSAEDKQKWIKIAVLRQLHLLLRHSAEYKNQSDYLKYKKMIISSGGKISLKEEYIVYHLLSGPRCLKRMLSKQ